MEIIQNKSFFYRRLFFNLRFFSSEKINKNLLNLMKTNEDESKMLEKSEKKKIDVTMIPSNAKDNFLIQFNKRTPTYDQLFEYKIDEKLYNKSKDMNESYFLSTDMKIFMHKKYDLTLFAFKRFFRQYIYKNQLPVQKYSIKRHGILGPDLAAANFILGRGGKVRFKHLSDKWFVNVKSLPKTFDKKYRLISIDASNLNLFYEGLDNLIMLNELEELNLSNNLHLDDWACEKLARMFRNSQSLNYLNLTNLPRVSHRGIEVLHKIPSLKTLVVKETKAIQYPFFELVVLMFNEVNPYCKIVSSA